MKAFNGPISGERFVFLLFRSNNEIIEFNHWDQIEKYKCELKISSSSIQFFLRNGCIFPPYTIYANVMMLPVGSRVEIDIDNDIFNWIDSFNYLDENSNQSNIPSVSFLKSLISNSFSHLINEKRNIFVMQSAGKDSTAMLIGLHEKGIKNVHCVTYEANFRDSESIISKEIAENLGFKHSTLYPDYEKEFDALIDYQKNAINITGDFSMLPYISANKYIFDKNSLVIDGLGNDLYMGYVSNFLERSIMKLSIPWLNKYEPSKFTNSEIINYAISSIFMYPFERLIPGTRLSVSEIELLLDSSYTHKNLSYFKKKYENLDKDDFRAAIRARFCDSSMFQMKAELTTNSFGNEIYFPFSNKDLVDYYFNLPLEHRYDKINGVNKKLLRDLLNKSVSNDDFFKKKSGFRYDMKGFINFNRERVIEEVAACDLINTRYVSRWFDNHLKNNNINYTSACKAYILLIFSTWRKFNDYSVVDYNIADNFNIS